ncbi:MAG: DNA primase DnaG [Thermoplasmatota archaeon]
MNTNIDPTTTKYLIRAEINADGVVEKPDVVGAIFGQTEGLLGNELDLRDLQKSGRIGRIEVDVDSKKGKSVGTIILPSSLDKVETAILAAALESIDRVGPCKAEIKVRGVEDVRIAKRKAVIDRARQLLHQLVESAGGESEDITDAVRDTIRVEEIVSFGAERLPAGPNVSKSDAILIVEGRNDVINLLKHGIKNAIAVEGTSVPKTIIDLTKDKVATAFVDGDRGGELILKELLQTAEVDFIARAPRSREVEELTQKQIMKSLRNKIPAEQFVEMYSLTSKPGGTRDNVRGRGRPEEAEDDEDEGPSYGPIDEVALAGGGAKTEERRPSPPRREERGRDERREDRREDRRDERREERGPREEPRGPPRERPEGFAPRAREERAPREERPPREEPPFEPVVTPAAPRAHGENEGKFVEILDELAGKLQAVMLTDQNERVGDKIAVRDLADTLKKAEGDKVRTVVFDGVVTQRLLDIAAEKGIATLVGVKTGNITKKPTNVSVLTRADLH